MADDLSGLSDTDLEALRAAPSSTPREQRTTCPECGSLRIRVRSLREHDRQRQGSGRYFCRDCGTDFDEGGGSDV